MMNVENRQRTDAQQEVITLDNVENMELQELVNVLIAMDSAPQARRDNNSIIISAALAAYLEGKINLTRGDLVGMVYGSAPNIHTYDAWKSRGYIVKHGERAAFSARIWKYTERRTELTEEQANTINAVVINSDGSRAQEGDEVISGNFIRKEAYFFTPEQVKILEELEEIPADCEVRRENGKEIITGNTKPIKEQLKASGYKWHKKNHYWFKFVA